MADARKSLQVLYDEWSSCTACALGERRQAIGGSFVFGEGCQGGIMFIGEGPGRNEEEQGRPFIGQSGTLLRDALDKLKFTDFYVTNLVTCRACEPMLDPTTNLPRTKQRRGAPPEILYRDVVPTPPQINACRARLYEEIYLVDPVLIVTLGGTAAEALFGRPVSITRERGRTEHIFVPGATHRPVLTDRRQVWGRKVGGEYKLPTEVNEVRYLVLPTLHPAYVLRKLGDRGANSPIRQFGDDLRMAVKIYERYLNEAFGVDATSTSDADLSNIGGLYEPEGEEDPGVASA